MNRVGVGEAALERAPRLHDVNDEDARNGTGGVSFGVFWFSRGTNASGMTSFVFQNSHQAGCGQ